jgi:hypothetical protein
MKVRPVSHLPLFISIGLALILTLLITRPAHAQADSVIQIDTMHFTLIGPAIKGDTFVTVRKVRSAFDQINSHVDELEHGFLFLRATTAEAQQNAATLQFTVDSLKQELQKAKTCRNGDSKQVP